MVATHGQATALSHRALGEQHIVSRSAADINHERAKVFLVLREHDLCRSKAAKDHVFHIQRQFL